MGIFFIDFDIFIYLRYDIGDMKSLRRLSLLSLLISSLILTGCFNRQKEYEPIQLEKQDINYTYKDYENHNVYNVDSAPTIGTTKLLVIPIWFTNSSSYIPESQKSKVKADIEKAYFGTNQDTGWRSVKTYYEEESHGALKIEGVVSDWYNISYSSSMYYKGTKDTKELMVNAVKWYKGNHDNAPLTDFDRDNNGYLDGVMLIYAAPDYSTFPKTQWDSMDNMWAYCYWAQEESYKNVNNPGPNQYFWASYDFMYGKNSGVGSHFSGDTSIASIDTHTYIHEMGHIFGLEDYYDYSGQCNPAGSFSMQDLNIGGHDPYSVMAFGWAKPYVPTESCTIKIKDFQSSGDLVLLTNSFKNSPFDEYLLLELYSPTGLNEFDVKNSYQGRYPTGPNYYGIRLWHVDGRLLYVREGDKSFSASRITNVIENDKTYAHLCSNTYYDKDHEEYCSPLGKSYSDFNIVQLIRNNILADYEEEKDLQLKDLFYEGDSFSMTRFSQQFVNKSLLNNKERLGWSFYVNEIKDGVATLTFQKG